MRKRVYVGPLVVIGIESANLFRAGRHTTVSNRRSVRPFVWVVSGTTEDKGVDILGSHTVRQ